MPHALTDKLIIGISSRALFNLDDSNTIYESEGIDAYAQHQISHENDILQPGIAFPLVQKFLGILHPETQEPFTELILISRNSADTGLRIFNSIQHHNLNITRAAFTSGKSPYQYISAFGAHLFLSAHSADVNDALCAGCAAATICLPPKTHQPTAELRIAFDGDAVIFSDEAEKIYHQHGLDAFTQSESQNADIPLAPGPFQGFLYALHTIQQQFSDKDCPIRTALVTARSAPTHERVIQTLRSWNIRIDEAIFLGGLDKGEFLKAFQADFYFDDQTLHCNTTQTHVPTGHVPHGIKNQ